jgi:hypothetical protein
MLGFPLTGHIAFLGIGFLVLVLTALSFPRRDGPDDLSLQHRADLPGRFDDREP